MAKLFNTSTIALVDVYREKEFVHHVFSIDLISLDDSNTQMHTQKVRFELVEGVVEIISTPLSIREMVNFSIALLSAEELIKVCCTKQPDLTIAEYKKLKEVFRYGGFVLYDIPSKPSSYILSDRKGFNDELTYTGIVDNRVIYGKAHLIPVHIRKQIQKFLGNV